ncbi:MAG: hypothetical protein Q8K59_00410 [Nitrosomonas sp.]|nr:hypothetical protein [Nitrosomonas sp.]MDP1949565.1 hypothetical protein [Nitrosomonas sp.]
MTKRGKQASRKAAARKYGFLEVPSKKMTIAQNLRHGTFFRKTSA